MMVVKVLALFTTAATAMARKKTEKGETTTKKECSAWQLARRVYENGQPLTTQSLWYHSLSGNINFRLQGIYAVHVCYSQARLNGVLGQTSILNVSGNTLSLH